MGTELQGIATRTGIGIGNAQILELGQGEAFGSKNSLHGKVLVTSMTNPGMVRQMKEAAAVICESGGRSSHAALLCSEIGKPCVVGIPNLLNTIRTWSGPQPIKMKVDGSTGKVEIMDFVLIEE